jgi:flagellar hook protein FlgE
VDNSHIVFLDYSTLGLDHQLIKGASYFTHTPEELVAERIKHAQIIVTNKVVISAKSIEQSNVDIASEFINLMAAQRNFQANTKTITTSDQMLQEVLNIKR